MTINVCVGVDEKETVYARKEGDNYGCFVKTVHI